MIMENCYPNACVFSVKDLTENWFSAILNAKNSFVEVYHIFLVLRIPAKQTLNLLEGDSLLGLSRDISDFRTRVWQ